MADKRRFGIDISKWQEDFDLQRAVSHNGVEFVIAKASGGDGGKGLVLYKDRQFENNYAKAKAIGLPVGAYHFGNARTVQEAEKEADFFLSCLAGKQLDMPVWYDVENPMINYNGRINLTNIITAFCDKVEKAGYWVGIYSSSSVFNSKMVDSSLKRFSHWVACWQNKPNPNKPPKLASGAATQMWQESSSKIINNRRVDTDWCYVDYPRWIKNKKLNGYK